MLAVMREGIPSFAIRDSRPVITGVAPPTRDRQMKNAIVTARFTIINPQGEALTLKIAIKAPEPVPKTTHGDWRCKVKLAGLCDNSFIYGVDGLQALSLAIKYVETELRAFSDAGWQFYLPDCPNQPIDITARYFPAM